jgi:hypothetical protein
LVQLFERVARKGGSDNVNLAAVAVVDAQGE